MAVIYKEFSVLCGQSSTDVSGYQNTSGRVFRLESLLVNIAGHTSGEAIVRLFDAGSAPDTSARTKVRLVIGSGAAQVSLNRDAIGPACDFYSGVFIQSDAASGMTYVRVAGSEV